nr:helix-turn-helix transcriptional regulator [uncultured Prevotella sp.]
MGKTEYQQIIITRLKKLREEKGYSQQSIATILGLSNGQIGNIESCKQTHKYTLSQIRILCKEFNIRIEQIFLDDKDYRTKNIIDLLIGKIIAYGE